MFVIVCMLVTCEAAAVGGRGDNWSSEREEELCTAGSSFCCSKFCLGARNSLGFRNSSVRSDGILRHRWETRDCAAASLTRDCKTRSACMWVSRLTYNYFRGLTRKKRSPLIYFLFRVNENKCIIPLCYHLQFSGHFYFLFLMHCDLIMLGLQMTSELRTTPTNDKWCIFVVVFGGVSEWASWHSDGTKWSRCGWYSGTTQCNIPVRSVISVSSAGLSAGTLGYFRK